MNWKEIAIMGVVVFVFAIAALYAKQYIDSKQTA